ncbi:hypothetical protein DXX97_09385 [Lactococcus lactis]|nr:hypothetical protein [Lactococcus lactis]
MVERWNCCRKRSRNHRGCQRSCG